MNHLRPILLILKNIGDFTLPEDHQVSDKTEIPNGARKRKASEMDPHSDLESTQGRNPAKVPKLEATPEEGVPHTVS